MGDSHDDLKTRLKPLKQTTTINAPEGNSDSFWISDFFPEEGNYVILISYYNSVYNQKTPCDCRTNTGKSRALALAKYTAALENRLLTVYYF